MDDLFASVPPAPSTLSSIPPRPMPTLVGTRIAFHFIHLHERARITELHIRPGDASCEKSPPDASPSFDPPPQPIETEHLTTSSIKLPHTRTRCVTRVGCLTGLGKPGPPAPGPRLDTTVVNKSSCPVLIISDLSAL